MAQELEKPKSPWPYTRHKKKKQAPAGQEHTAEEALEQAGEARQRSSRNTDSRRETSHARVLTESDKRSETAMGVDKDMDSDTDTDMDVVLPHAEDDVVEQMLAADDMSLSLPGELNVGWGGLSHDSKVSSE
jgi:hypothetical protein